MGLFKAAELDLARTISRLDYCNPFLPERLTLERRALGADYVGFEQVLNVRSGAGHEEVEENIRRLVARVGRAVEMARQRLAGGFAANEREHALYEDLALFYLYHSHHLRFREWILKAQQGAPRRKLGFFAEFEESARRLLFIPGVDLPHRDPPEHLFAFFFQMNRAFVNIYHNIVGGSLSAAKLRGAIWQSIFTHDLRRYRRSLYLRMGDISTLITGPSGTGKELVAVAVGLSRYIPFDRESLKFTEDFVDSLHALNLSALSPTLIESELFGHRRGAFTGALEDRAGWFEQCGPLGAVFLDEIGDLDLSIQVKLLRVLQTRRFQRLGEAGPRSFQGKLIAATNRDLDQALSNGAFREDLYYRLCADMITTPSLRDQLGQDASELRHLVRFIAAQIAGQEADELTGEVMEWVERKLGFDYSWPGNFRELEQCVRNILIRKEYHPASGRLPAAATQGDAGHYLEAARSGKLTADELLTAYCRHVHSKTGSFAEAARRLGLDRRTVKARVLSDGG